MSYTVVVQPYPKGIPPTILNLDSQRLYLEQELKKLQTAVKSLADAVAEIKSKLAAASSLPIT